MSLLLLLTGGTASGGGSGGAYPPTAGSITLIQARGNASLGGIASRLAGNPANNWPVADHHSLAQIQALYPTLVLDTDVLSAMRTLVYHLTGQRIGVASREYLLGVLDASLTASGY